MKIRGSVGAYLPPEMSYIPVKHHVSQSEFVKHVKRRFSANGGTLDTVRPDIPYKGRRLGEFQH